MDDFYISPKVKTLHSKTCKKFKVKSLSELPETKKKKALDYMETIAKKLLGKERENI